MSDVVRAVVACCHRVRRTMGLHHSESVYHRALEVELRRRHLSYESEVSHAVTYEGHFVGVIRMDLIVERNVVVELKAVPRLNDQHGQQVLKYMHVTGMSHGLLTNFWSDDEPLEFQK